MMSGLKSDVRRVGRWSLGVGHLQDHPYERDEGQFLHTEYGSTSRMGRVGQLVEQRKKQRGYAEVYRADTDHASVTILSWYHRGISRPRTQI